MKLKNKIIIVQQPTTPSGSSTTVSNKEETKASHQEKFSKILGKRSTKEVM
jgi:hypothetical protein